MAGGTRSASGLPGSLARYAELVRVPNLFTAPPDVLLGAALAAGTGAGVPLGGVAGLAVASVLLYAGGTALNDAFDAPSDATERPERPIPSGRVSRRTGFGLGALFLTCGVAAAGLAAGVGGGVAAAAVATGVLLYDGALKGGPVGFATMGAVRGLNVLLGTTAATGAAVALSASGAGVVLAVTAYVAAVTYMADAETRTGERGRVLVAAAGAVVATAALLGRLLLAAPTLPEAAATLALGAGFGAWIAGPLRRAYRSPDPGTVGSAVGKCVLGLVILDAAFVATVGPGWAVAIAAFLLPAVGLERRFDVS
ncbi:UbiA family prenyltransferase [Halorussus sp. AFM4]|uniref:UbiA family prenyltransferase n=1 Tax=Halorussus sp. AFM4 TaxID=3421651 RepID=UPI003EBE31CB